MKNKSEKYRVWIEAQRRHKLSDAHVQMARELGMNPKSLGGLDNDRQEPWKSPLPVFIENCYEKRFGRRLPNVVTPLMQGLREHERKKRARKKQRRLNQRMIAAKDLSIVDEADYISDSAARRECRVISLGPLVFFSTPTGDAWALDPEDGRALRLASGGERMPAVISESKESFSIAWSHDYRIDGESMVFVDDAGQARTIIGYPVREIAEAAGRALSRRAPRA